MALKILITLLFYIFIEIHAVLYDAVTGTTATEEMLRLYQEKNNTRYCTVNVKPCDPTEWKRVDGTCNNLKYPSRGGVPSANFKLLPETFSVDYEPRNTQSGSPLPSPRQIRVELLQEGRAHELSLTLLVGYYVLFTVDDLISLHDILDYIWLTTNCCTPAGKSNYMCTPIKVAVDDPVHRYSGVNCMNLTRPQTFQYHGCLDVGTPFVRIMFTTPLYDLSLVYRHRHDSINHIRTFKDGLLKIDESTFKKTNKIFPLGNHSEAHNKQWCMQNQYPRESLCYVDITTTNMGPALFTLIHYRLHNYIAKELYKMNPCWDDDLIFFTARDINMATHMQIYFYELLPILHSKEVLIKEGILSSTQGFREIYDDTLEPQTSEEFFYLHRWYHTIQDATLRFYDKKGYFLNTYPIVNTTFREGFFAVDDNIDKILAGSYRQVSGKFDHTIDYELAERSLGNIHYVGDVASSDLNKGRYLGFSPYIKYREFCTKRPHKSFDDLKDVMSEERIHRLKEVYKNVEDIELMAGVWSENRIPYGKVPHTLHCVYMEQLRRSVAFDRHWYERPNRPHAFTHEQLQSIRKMTMAGLLCAVGDGVTEIQPKAFYSIHKKDNPLTECVSPKIGKLDLTHWKDPKCDK